VSALAAYDKRLINGALGRLQAFAIPDSRIEVLKKTRQVPRTLTIYAPADGHVTELSVREGSFIDPSQTVLELVASDRVWVRADVLERQSTNLTVGQTASMTVDYLPSRVWHGKVDYVFPMLDMNTRTQPVRLRFDNFDRQLKPNMFSRIKIDGPAFSALTVAREAVIRMSDHARVVKSLGQGRYRSARVEVGREVGERVVILSGLASGMEVVTSAQFLLDSESSIGADLSRYEPLNELEAAP
jgi:Cu(I)/Ag(I) efflux system membrane fusion protein